MHKNTHLWTRKKNPQAKENRTTNACSPAGRITLTAYYKTPIGIKSKDGNKCFYELNLFRLMIIQADMNRWQRLWYVRSCCFGCFLKCAEGARSGR